MTSNHTHSESWASVHMLGKPTFMSSAGLMGMLLLCQVTRQDTSLPSVFHYKVITYIAPTVACSLPGVLLITPSLHLQLKRGFTGLFTGGSEVRPQLVNSFNFSQGFKYHAGAGVKGNMGKRIPNFISKPIIKTNKNGQLEKKRPGWLV